MLRHVLLQLVQSHFAVFEVRTCYLMSLVVNTKYNPGKVTFAKIGFVAQCREILAQIVHVITILSSLEFHHFILIMTQQMA